MRYKTVRVNATPVLVRALRGRFNISPRLFVTAQFSLGDLLTRASRGWLAGMVLAACTVSRAVDAAPAWTPAPYLMLDERLVAHREQVRRELHHPSRLPEPIVTAAEDKNFQPWISVLRDPESGRFRMWYNIPARSPDVGRSHLAYLESEDGIHWLRPHRVLATAPIQFGASVIDEGPGYAEPQKRFKAAWWKDGGLQVAASPDGIVWTALAPGLVLRTTHDVTGIAWDPIRRRYLGLVSMTPPEFQRRRIPYESVSDDLIHWKPPWQTIIPDPKAEIEKGETQFYGLNGVIARGSLLIGVIKVLRDDLNCEPGKTAIELHDKKRPFAGLGYTVLGWSYDGEHWQRDTEPFLDRNPQPGTWDRAMTWADSQIIVGDQLYIYYGGYRWGHKADNYTERQIGLARMPRDRCVALAAGKTEGLVRTRLAKLAAARMTVNARVSAPGGQLRVRILDEAAKPYAGFDWDDAVPVQGDRVDHPIKWKGNLADLRDKPVQFEFKLAEAELYSFDLR